DKLKGVYPVEGAIVGRDGDLYRINIGRNADIGLAKGALLDVLGSKRDEYGKKIEFDHIGVLEVQDVQENDSLVKIKKLAERSLIDIGDKVVVKGKMRNMAQGQRSLKITGIESDGRR